MRSEFLKRHLSYFLIQAPKFIFAGLVLLLVPIAVSAVTAGQRLNVSVSSSAPYNHCVDGIQNYDETGTDCGGAMCSACANHCTNHIKDFDETGVDCGGALCSSCGGGGGGGGGGVTIAASVNFSGKAAPGATVKVLKDGVLVGLSTASNAADFSITISGLSNGNYRFIIYYDDTETRRSYSYIYNLDAVSGQSTAVANILLSPTVGTDKAQIKKGDWLDISGQSVPNSSITVSIAPKNGGPETLLKTTTDATGKYFLKYIAAELTLGDYLVKAKVTINNISSDYSSPQVFTVGTKTVEEPRRSRCPLKGDVNNDCRVNLVDFSITAYWFKRQIDANFTPIEAGQLSGDGAINLVDFSILAYYWTG